MDDNSADIDGVLVNVPVKVAKSKKNSSISMQLQGKNSISMKGVF
jgi:hypothetical protein